MSNLNFYIGAKIVCIDVNFQNIEFHQPSTRYPELGKVYTISRIFDTLAGDVVCFLLEEIRNPPCKVYGTEVMFFSWHFAPVKKTDISIFEAMLKPIPKVHIKELEMS